MPFVQRLVFDEQYIYIYINIYFYIHICIIQNHLQTGTPLKRAALLNQAAPTASMSGMSCLSLFFSTSSSSQELGKISGSMTLLSQQHDGLETGNASRILDLGLYELLKT